MECKFLINDFEGPLDLLLHLIKKDNIDICDISISEITKQYLDYLEQMEKMESMTLPQDFDYNNVSGLRIEATQKLNKIKPLSLGQASRISGVSPADISVLLIYIKRNKIK